MESYIFVREVGLLPFETSLNDMDALCRTLSLSSPAAIFCNNGTMVVADSVLNAFDKLEVLEYTAEALIDSHAIGGNVAMPPEVIEELKELYNLK